MKRLFDLVFCGSPMLAGGGVLCVLSLSILLMQEPAPLDESYSRYAVDERLSAANLNPRDALAASAVANVVQHKGAAIVSGQRTHSLTDRSFGTPVSERTKVDYLAIVTRQCRQLVLSCYRADELSATSETTITPWL